MLLNLNDPVSILTWWQILPERHDEYLTHKARVSPEFAPAINEARRRIAATPQLAGQLTLAVQRRRRFEAQQADQDEGMSSLQ